jgi:hypothetical protein
MDLDAIGLQLQQRKEELEGGAADGEDSEIKFNG